MSFNIPKYKINLGRTSSKKYLNNNLKGYQCFTNYDCVPTSMIQLGYLNMNNYNKVMEKLAIHETGPAWDEILKYFNSLTDKFQYTWCTYFYNGSEILYDKPEVTGILDKSGSEISTYLYDEDSLTNTQKDKAFHDLLNFLKKSDNTVHVDNLIDFIEKKELSRNKGIIIYIRFIIPGENYIRSHATPLIDSDGKKYIIDPASDDDPIYLEIDEYFYYFIEQSQCTIIGITYLVEIL